MIYNRNPSNMHSNLLLSSTNKFCAKHRLPEAHACSNMEHCRQSSHERLAGKLLKERTVAAKV
ncbi:hypothetical protein BATDEDRAFT_85577 [Batrachochytrium dendrobatidis JAM81]|uniref:AN1-type domain-containing protein n=1 Tax=Batrachochytrium dendrobatidis (strain JAM81 / FGSC 10211) TaxID=684364 RepID=F4NST3_BATDJ|nr:uncharacterized protein BATDEDRAFT_85577 [Batrachochytrium dendrobatidis JAM81]EGF83845.1 hypothetical protein BATDEDRAFT_85577 [Batrachochytrium dendrobatidis JAM81]|eukprot:XP_006676242.1 hypothetical protein BATDEDRAFT_85577 [Batrachochytrium dendrobatidis JAM81]